MAVPATSKRRWLRGAAAAAVVCGLVGCLQGAVRAASSRGWRVEATANPSITRDTSPGAVSCSSASACTDVGSYLTPSGASFPLALRWNGVGWVRQAPAAPSDSSFLYGVSCPSTGECLAVGSTGENLLVEGWNGSRWSLQSPAAPASGTDPIFTTVSCASTTYCLAGGFVMAGGGVTPLSETWNGTTWSDTSPPAPFGSNNSSFNDVACQAVNDCIAVGSYLDSSDVMQPFAEVWDGTSWTPESAPLPNGAAGGIFFSVSCPPLGGCYVVGEQEHGHPVSITALAEEWNGTAWTILQPSTPHKVSSLQLNSVSCSASSACTAVGQANTDTVETPVVERWNGSSWTLQSAPVEQGDVQANLQGVSCATSSDCVALGIASDPIAAAGVAIADVWNGRDWRSTTPPDPPAGENVLAGVSCAGRSECGAVGTYVDSYGDNTALAEAWSGTSWRGQTTAEPKGATSANLNGISCASTDLCLAVGGYSDVNGTAKTLAEKWSRGSWAVDTTPTIKGSQSATLTGVSCPVPSRCTAVGSYLDAASVNVVVAERLEGHTWSLQRAKDPRSSPVSILDAVSCPTTGSCMAVGRYQASSTLLALSESWTAKGWKLDSPAPVPGTTFAQLSSVSCSAASACTAVGYMDVNKKIHVLIERWNGSKWIEQHGAPLSVQGAELWGVDCAAAKSCTAVGSVPAAGGPVPLIEQWNGTRWTRASSPLPRNAESAGLNAVSCSATLQCTAVGTYGDQFGDVETFAEREG